MLLKDIFYEPDLHSSHSVAVLTLPLNSKTKPQLDWNRSFTISNKVTGNTFMTWNGTNVDAPVNV